MNLKYHILWKGNEVPLRKTCSTWSRRWGWQWRDAKEQEEVPVARGRWGQGKALGWSQYQVSMKPSGARASFSCLPRRGKQGPGEHFTQDRRLLSRPRMSIRSNEAALLSARSSGSYSGREKKKNKRAKARGALPGDSNTKLKLQEYHQDIALPDEEIKVKSNPFGPRKVRVRGSLFRTLNNSGAFLLPGPMTNSSSSPPVSGVSW